MTGIRVTHYIHTEPQRGKAVLDGLFGVCTQALTRYVREGRDTTTPKQLFDALVRVGHRHAVIRALTFKNSKFHVNRFKVKGPKMPWLNPTTNRMNHIDPFTGCKSWRETQYKADHLLYCKHSGIDTMIKVDNQYVGKLSEWDPHADANAALPNDVVDAIHARQDLDEPAQSQIRRDGVTGWGEGQHSAANTNSEGTTPASRPSASASAGAGTTPASRPSTSASAMAGSMSSNPASTESAAASHGSNNHRVNNAVWRQERRCADPACRVDGGNLAAGQRGHPCTRCGAALHGICGHAAHQDMPLHRICPPCLQGHSTPSAGRTTGSTAATTPARAAAASAPGEASDGVTVAASATSGTPAGATPADATPTDATRAGAAASHTVSSGTHEVDAKNAEERYVLFLNRLNAGPTRKESPLTRSTVLSVRAVVNFRKTMHASGSRTFREATLGQSDSIHTCNKCKKDFTTQARLRMHVERASCATAPVHAGYSASEFAIHLLTIKAGEEHALPELTFTKDLRQRQRVAREHRYAARQGRSEGVQLPYGWARGNHASDTIIPEAAQILDGIFLEGKAEGRRRWSAEEALEFLERAQNADGTRRFPYHKLPSLDRIKSHFSGANVRLNKLAAAARANASASSSDNGAAGFKRGRFSAHEIMSMKQQVENGTPVNEVCLPRRSAASVQKQVSKHIAEWMAHAPPRHATAPPPQAASSKTVPSAPAAL